MPEKGLCYPWKAEHRAGPCRQGRAGCRGAVADQQTERRATGAPRPAAARAGTGTSRSTEEQRLHFSSRCGRERAWAGKHGVHESDLSQQALRAAAQLEVGSRGAAAVAALPTVGDRSGVSPPGRGKCRGCLRVPRHTGLLPAPPGSGLAPPSPGSRWPPMPTNATQPTPATAEELARGSSPNTNRSCQVSANPVLSSAAGPPHVPGLSQGHCSSR